MKQKNFNQKLVLNKSTVSNLGQKQMKDAKGGFRVTCRTNCTIGDPLCSDPAVCATYDSFCVTMMLCTG